MKKQNTALRLQDCTKAELLFVIDSLKRHLFDSGDFYIDLALQDIAFGRDQQRLKKAEEINALASAKRREYSELLSPYEGMKLGSIPRNVIFRADCLLKEIALLDDEWGRLIGITAPLPKRKKTKEALE